MSSKSSPVTARVLGSNATPVPTDSDHVSRRRPSWLTEKHVRPFANCPRRSGIRRRSRWRRPTGRVDDRFRRPHHLCGIHGGPRLAAAAGLRGHQMARTLPNRRPLAAASHGARDHRDLAPRLVAAIVARPRMLAVGFKRILDQVRSMRRLYSSQRTMKFVNLTETSNRRPAHRLVGGPHLPRAVGGAHWPAPGAETRTD